MLDLPPIKWQVYENLVEEIEQMRRGGSNDNPKPHKLIMLLSVLQLIDRGAISENKIPLSQDLISLFKENFLEFAGTMDWCQPGPPFFHLRSTSFWKHQVIPGREAAYSKLKTTGGGLKRITDNILYAFFEPSVYDVISDGIYRAELIQRLKTMLGVTASQTRLPTVFHESFSLSRPSLTQILNAIHRAGKEIDFSSSQTRIEYFRSITSLGMSYVKAMPEYAKGAGLIDQNYRLTTFGVFANEFDLNLDLLSTQWLMHYYLSQATGPGPLFWHDIVTTRFRTGDSFLQDDLQCHITEIYQRIEGKPLSNRSAATTVTVFLGTYMKSDGLGKLGILEDAGNRAYRVLEPDLPPTWAVAIAILDYWKAHFPNQVTINMNDLYDEKGPASQFMISRSRLTMILSEMQEAGIVELNRIAPPYQVMLLQRDAASLYRRLYGADERE